MTPESDKGNSAKSFVVALGDLYASPCRVCGRMGYYGITALPGHNGCQDAVRRGEVYCGGHIHNAQEHRQSAAESGDFDGFEESP